ncbi:DUF4339 domain-containing protein [Brevifollis gellanilyticus]|uniref:GYF domain-containing protein n=1 Tax=Brevifollis gellanilyticus TaxID=748831 RepID=A0A512M2C4_9BACT|nr:DUF4339 domain-containing protein [Brevifollis gellanilyticus]GEP40889.1 hypothetical protein BGE01nite_01800 [Brevifollis gellanilyticus]
MSQFQYYISKGGKTVGPCTLDDLRSYLAYGSVQVHDLALRDGETDWRPLLQLDELRLHEGADFVQDITRRQRVARYREYEKVPLPKRSGWVLREMLIGFFFFPPKLWRASASVLQGRVYRPEANADGFLKHWPRWVEFFVQFMLIVNAAVWILLLWVITMNAMPLVREMVDLAKTGAADLKN